MKCAHLQLLIAIFIFVSAQAQRQQKFNVYHGQPGITKKLSELQPAAAAQRTQKLHVFQKPMEFKLNEIKKFEERLKRSEGSKISTMNEEAPDDNTGELLEPANTSTQHVWSNFLASTFEQFPYFTPPDPNGAVGPTQVVTITNNMLSVFEKKAVTDPPLLSYKGVLHTPAPAAYEIPTYFFFSPLLSETSFPADPHVRYDRLTKRWFIVAIELNQPLQNNNILLAVSDGDRITDASSFIYYRFPSALLPYKGGTTPPWIDYPRMGVDKNAVLVGGSGFFTHTDSCGFTYFDSLYSVGYAIDKKPLLSGELTLYAIKLGQIQGDGSGGGVIVPQGVQNDNPAAPKSFFAGISNDGAGLVLAALTYDKNGLLADVSEKTVSVEPFQFPRDVTALGSPMPIEPNDTRLLEVSIHKNKLTGKSGLWTAHAIGVNKAGNFVKNNDFINQARTGARWYELADVYTKPRVAQSGTVFDSTKTSGRRAASYFNPSITPNGQGTALLGGTRSAYNGYLNAFISGRFADDAPGTLGTPQRVTATRAIYALNFGQYEGRWGDYSQTVVDPTDDQTLWTFQEYTASDDNFGLRAIQVKAPPPATPLPPGDVSNSDDVTITLDAVSVGHSGFFDPGSDKGGPGYNRLSVKATNGLLVSNLKFISPTQLRFRLNTKNKPAGDYTLVITNPDGQIVTTSLTVVAGITKSLVSASKLAESEARTFIASSTVTPNPTAGTFTLQIVAAKDWAARIVIVDASGKLVSASRVGLSKGSNAVPLSVAGRDSGTYIAIVYNQANSVIAVQKIIKQ